MPALSLQEAWLAKKPAPSRSGYNSVNSRKKRALPVRYVNLTRPFLYWVKGLARETKLSVPAMLTPIASHQNHSKTKCCSSKTGYKGDIRSARKFSKSKPRPKKKFARKDVLTAHNWWSVEYDTAASCTTTQQYKGKM